MRCFNITIATTAISENSGPLEDVRLAYHLPDEAVGLLEPLLSAYGQDPEWYFDSLNYGRPPAPWAIACLDREYAIAGHIVESRASNLDIAFSTYTPVPRPIPARFVPKVGLLTFASKGCLRRSAANSPIFAAAWEALSECTENERWLVLLDTLPKDWLTKVLPDDQQRWFRIRGQ